MDKVESEIKVNIRGKPEVFDIVVLTLGFGPEESHLKTEVPHLTVPDYWQPEDLLSTDLVSSRARTLISGQGDGALIDALRAAYGGASFSHSSILQQYTENRRFQDFLGILVYWSNCTASTADGYADELSRQCEALWQKWLDETTDPTGVQWFSPLLPKHLPNHCDVVEYPDSVQPGVWILGGKSANSFLRGPAAFIHRIIVWILVRTGYIKALKLDHVESVCEVPDGLRYVVKVGQRGIRYVELEFDRVILRHGPNPVKHLSRLNGLDEYLQKFRDIAALRLLPPKVSEDISQWSNLGGSVLILPNLPGIRFLAEGPEGPWMMERPVTQAIWARVHRGVQLAEERTKEAVRYREAKSFLQKFNGLLRELDVQDPRYSGFRCRLPRVEEWLRFAGCSGDRERGLPKYPWGDEPVTAMRAHVAGVKEEIGDSARYLGRGPSGHIDLVGEVWEWCESGDASAASPPALLGGSKATFASDALTPLIVDPNFFARDIGLRIVLERTSEG